MIIDEDSAIDLDWFAKDVTGNVIHFASGGGLIPTWVKNVDYNLLISYFRNLPETSPGVNISPVLEHIKGSPPSKSYLQSFTGMSKKGLFSFDKSLINNFQDDRYHLVCAPELPLSVRMLPSYISDSLLMINFRMEATTELRLGELTELPDLD